MHLGFNWGTDGPVATGGKKAIDIHREIVQELFVDPLDTAWTTDDIAKLKDVVKNCINVCVINHNYVLITKWLVL